jgi:hypothetical protein
MRTPEIEDTLEVHGIPGAKTRGKATMRSNGEGASKWLMAVFGLAGLSGLLLATAPIHADDGFSWDADLRLRTEYRGPFNYVDTGGGDPTSDDGTYSRLRLGLDYAVAPGIGLRLELQDSRVLGGDGGASADADLGVQRAYFSMADMKDLGLFDWLGEMDPVALMIGRQEVPTYGDGYILGNNDWDNAGGSSFDGVRMKGSVGTDDFGVDAEYLYAELLNADPYTTGANGAADDTILWGFTATTGDIPWVDLDAYYWVVNRSNSDDERIFGWRVSGALPDSLPLTGLDLSLEYAVADGRRDGDRLDANFWVLQGNYLFQMHDVPYWARFGVSHASGTSGDASENETWQAPLPNAHAHLGRYDLFANSNIDDLWVGFGTELASGMEIGADLHVFTLSEQDDGWYTVTGQQFGAGGSITDDDLGRELDVWARWGFLSESTLETGLSVFWAGDAVEEATGGYDDDGLFLYLQLSVPLGGS